MNDTPTDLPLAEDILATVGRWQGWLGREKRAARHTRAAYAFDLHNLFRFLVHYDGRQVTLKRLAELTLGNCTTAQLSF